MRSMRPRIANSIEREEQTWMTAIYCTSGVTYKDTVIETVPYYEKTDNYRWKRKVSPETTPMNIVSRSQTEEPRQHVGAEMVPCTDGAGAAGHPRAEQTDGVSRGVHRALRKNQLRPVKALEGSRGRSRWT